MWLEYLLEDGGDPGLRRGNRLAIGGLVLCLVAVIGDVTGWPEAILLPMVLVASVMVFVGALYRARALRLPTGDQDMNE